MQQPTQQAAPAAAPAAPAAPAEPAPAAAPAADDPVAVLKRAKEMLDAGLITQEDFNTRKVSILSEI